MCLLLVINKKRTFFRKLKDSALKVLTMSEQSPSRKYDKSFAHNCQNVQTINILTFNPR